MPTVNPSPFGPKPAFFDTAGEPAVGYRLFSYVAGSVNTKRDTYTDSTGSVANTNPVVLNALGEPTTQYWFQAGLAYKIVYAPPGSDDPPNSPIWTIDNLTGINDVTATADQWVAFAGTPTFVGATSFTLVGDQTSTFHIGRRLKTTNSGGTVYSTISNSVFGAVTTVTVLNDGAGVLDAGLSAVSYGLVSYVNPSILGGWVAFPAIQKLSTDPNTLDDYEEGTWTPTLTFATPGDLNVVYTTRVGTYIKVGRQVTLQCNILTSTFTFTTAAGICVVNGVPFASANVTGARSTGGLVFQGVTKVNYTNIVSEIEENASRVVFQASASAQAQSGLGAADMPTGSVVILKFSITYFAAA